ncbi:MAG: hypothetical protein Q9195_004174 [Heterodermia aff. obscurata]
MSPQAQQDAGDLNTLGFPIRLNNGISETNTQDTNTTQSQQFPSLADMGSSLPPSCDLVEYARGASHSSTYLHVPIASPSSNPSYVPRIPLPDHDHNPFADFHPSGPPPLPVPAYIPGTPIPNQVYRPGTTLYTPQPSPVSDHPQALRPRYTLTSSPSPPLLRVAMLPPFPSTFSPSPHIPHDPFPSAPISSGSFTHGAFPDPPSSSGSSASDEEDSLPNELAAMSLYPNPEILITDFSTLTLDPSTQQPAVCTSPHCPIPEPHAQGLYLFGGLRFHLRSYCADGIARQVFGGSNPPPRVWEGLDRLAQGVGEEGDARAVAGFVGAHFV